MRRFVLLPAILLSVSSQAQIPVKKSMAIVQKATATWCGPCGQWGWTLHEDVMADNMPASNPKAFVFTCYGSSSSNYYNAAAGELTKWGQSYPNWGVNNVNRTAFSSNGGIYTTTTRNTIKTVVDSFALVDPTASTGFTYSISGNTINVNTKTQFWKATTGTFKVAVYVIEDSVLGYQNGQSSNVYHHYVLRGNMGSSVYGDQIATGSITANQTFTKNFTFTITDNTWNKNRIKILTVIWKQNGTAWEFFNANSEKSFATGVADIEAVDQLDVYPNPASSVLSVRGALTQQTATRISLVNAVGQVVYTKEIPYTGNQLSENLDVRNIANGMYMLHISTEGARTVQKIMVNH